MAIGDRHLVTARYYNCNFYATAIVASVTEGIDWAAYIGADDGWEEAQCIAWVAKYGAKLSAQDAKHFFPDIKLPYREWWNQMGEIR